MCGGGYDIRVNEKEFYKKMGVNEPVVCSQCMMQQRLAFRNEFNYYKRDCDLCHKSTISIYSEDKPYKVYCSACWWSDDYDPLEYGVDYDFDKPFFDQVFELSKRVPKLAIQNSRSENSEYTNFSSENKNCYVVVGGLGCEDCYYSYRIFYCKDVVDCFDLYKSEQCYECTQSRGLYNCHFCELCENSSDTYLSNNCRGCKNCFGCVNLEHKEFCIFNEQYSKEDYFKKIEELKGDFLQSRKKIESLKSSLQERSAYIINCENCTGDQLFNCKNCYECYVLKNSEECGHVVFGEKDQYCYSCNFSDNCELQYNSSNLEKNYNVICGNLVWYSKNSYYCSLCFNSGDLLGCNGMKKHQYCILNKQYSKDEYEELSTKIIESMKEVGQWGEFYPAQHSPFGYNETAAMDFFPLSKKEALERGFNWSDFAESRSTKEFKIIPQEREFYEKHELPLPTLHPEERHRNRLKRARLFF